MAEVEGVIALAVVNMSMMNGIRRLPNSVGWHGTPTRR
jgi:hypothetical protein